MNENNTYLENLAREFNEEYKFLSDPLEADGRCLWAVLVFAHYAAEQGIAVNLVRWSVLNHKYYDHWAIKLNSSKVIDFTRAQIDGKKGYVFDIRDYPRNYYDYKVYPANLFLKFFSMEKNSRQDGLISPILLKKFLSLRMQYDSSTKNTVMNSARCFIVFSYFFVIIYCLYKFN